MYDFIKSIVANGTSLWYNQYDPAAPFYGWSGFTAVLLFLLFVAVISFDFPQYFGRIRFVLMLNVANLLGYVTSSLYLMITGLRHSAGWVFLIWIIFMAFPFSWHFYERYVLSGRDM